MSGTGNLARARRHLDEVSRHIHAQFSLAAAPYLKPSMSGGSKQRACEMGMLKRLIPAAVLAGVVAAGPPAAAGTFVAWEVAGVAWNDVLNARAWPSSSSAIRAGYPNGTRLQMTGRCMNGVDLKRIARWSAVAQSRAVRATWCQIWHDPQRNGNWQEGWVYGKFIRPAHF